MTDKHHHHRSAMASALHPTHAPHPSSLSFSRQAGDVASFNTSFNSPMSSQHHNNPYAHAPVASLSASQNASSSFRQSFDENDVRPPATSDEPPQIYTANYSGVPVYEMEVQGVAVMRRRADSWLNATQILKVAGVDKGRRTKILEKEILTGKFEKIQGGYGRYQGTWIDYQRGRQFCRDYGVEDLLRPLLDYDINSDGTGNTAYSDTPTKEQAMAANRRKFFSSSMEGKVNGQGSRNTFFQNVGPTASAAITALNKATRFDSPMPRPASAQRKAPATIRRQSSQQGAFSQETNYMSASQQSNHSFTSDQMMFDGNHEMGFGLTGASQPRMSDAAPTEQEPPRKKMRTSFEPDPYLDPNLQDDDRTELADSFSQSQQQQIIPRDANPGSSLPPLPTPNERDAKEKQHKLLDLFSDPSRTDFTNHPAILHLSGQDLDTPLDSKGNTAMHWSAMLGKVKVVKALASKGANIFRSNAGGETPLMQAVSVNNTYEQNCFAEMLEYLGPLIELRDAQGRTVLHHIAVASGIKGRLQSSRYYLESLLEFVVLQGKFTTGNGRQVSFNERTQSKAAKSKLLTLPRFLSDVVNIQDKSGNTALNLVARIGSHAIINQLEEIGADFSIPNHKGFRPESFGIFPKNSNANSNSNQTHFHALNGDNSQGLGLSQDPSQQNETEGKPPLSQIEQIEEEIVATTSSILKTTHANHQTERNRLDSILSVQSSDLRNLATQHSACLIQLSDLKTAAKNRRNNVTKLKNLQPLTHRLRQTLQSTQPNILHTNANIQILETEIDPALLHSSETANLKGVDLPSTARMKALLRSYESHNAALSATLSKLKALQSDELEAMYRRVVSLCTNVPEENVDALLPALVGALEDE